MSLGVEGMRKVIQDANNSKESKGQASLTARKMRLANWRTYHIMQSAGNLRRKREGRVEGEDERGRAGGEEVAWRKKRNYWRLRTKEGRKGSSI